MAGLRVPEDMDGESLLPRLRKGPGAMSTGRSFLVSHQGQAGRNSPDCAMNTEGMQRCKPLLGLDGLCSCAGAKNNSYDCVRTVAPGENSIFCVFRDRVQFVEAYDLSSDPEQLANVGFVMTRSELEARKQVIEKLRQCKGRRECSLADIPSQQSPLT